jgi:alkyldihydroxyacetonephosphate synthase
VQVRPLPENEEFHAVFFPDWERALAACRDMAQARLPLSMLRLSTPVETATTLALAGHRWIVAGLERLLSIRGIGAEKCMLLIGVTGGRALTRAALLDALGIADSANGWHLGQSMGKAWHRNRFHAPYARNTLWEAGYAVDTLETAIDWTGVGALVEAIESALRSALAEEGERAHVFTHLSHLYPTGSNIYTSYIFRIAATPEATLDRWRRLKRAASRVIVEHRGTISHQHGVGTDHAEYLAAETGDLGVAAVRDLCRRFDPEGIMNPGKLVP